MRYATRLIPALRRLGVPLCLLFLSACAVTPSQPGAPGAALRSRAALAAFALDGRFSLRHDNQNASGLLNWTHDGTGDRVLLSSPLGQGLAEIVSGPDGARLTTSEGKTYAAADAEALTRQVLGYPLPLAQLADWVRASAAGADAVEQDVQGRPTRLRFAAWRIEYTYGDDDPDAVPIRLFAERLGYGTELRLRIDEWRRLQSP